MLRKMAVLLSVALAGNVQAQDASANIQVETFADFVAFQMNNSAFDMNVKVSGPSDYTLSADYPGSQVAYLDLLGENGDALADGLYKYEIKPVPVKRISREASSAMPDRNTLQGRSAPKVSPVSGTFRILDGQVVDPDRVEAGGDE
jgi:hypothetical protein